MVELLTKKQLDGYFLRDEYSASFLKMVLEGRIFKKESSSLSLGSMVDCLILTPDLFNDYYLIPLVVPSDNEIAILKLMPEFTEDCAKDAFAIFKEKNPDAVEKTWINKVMKHLAYHSILLEEKDNRKIVSYSDVRDSAKMAEVFKNSQFKNIFKGCWKQVLCTGRISIDITEDDIPLRGLIDAVNIDIDNNQVTIYDLKTHNGTRNMFFQNIKKFRYDLSASLYMYLIRQYLLKEGIETPETPLSYTFKWVVVTENDCYTVEATLNDLHVGRFGTQISPKYHVKGFEDALINVRTAKNLGMSKFDFDIEATLCNKQFSTNDVWK